MAENRRSGKLAVILHADIAGSTALVQQDEQLAHERIQDTFRRFSDTIGKYRGRVHELRGDALLAEFDRVSDAATAVLAFQAGQEDFNMQLNDNIRPTVRAGIAMGEVIIADGTLTGAGVVLAQRVEQLAETGGLCITAAIHEALPQRMPFDQGDLGEQRLKGFDEPVRVYTVRLSSNATIPEPESLPQTEAEIPKLPDKPSIAVLPFTNMSGDPEQEFFADGITEDIITELARYPGLFVIARNSTFTYKGQSVRIQDVGRELGVIYVVEGSVRKAGNRVRVTVQLIEAATENHIWAERYDRELSDIFEIQDELTRAIAGTLPARLEAADIDRIKRKPPQDLAAYDYVLRSKILHHVGTKEANAEALDVLDKAIEVDPDYAQAYAWKACTLRQAVLRGYAEAPDIAGKQRVENARKALALDENDMECLRILCEINMEQRDLAQAELYHNRAFAINPNDPRMAAQRGELMTWMGRHPEGIEWVETAMRLDPLGANAYSHLLGRALHGERRYAEAIKSYMQISDPRYQHHADMAACHAQMGNASDAERAVAESLRLKPDFSIESYLSILPYEKSVDRDHHREGLCKAGLPN
jgi:adenylate cyclase